MFDIPAKLRATVKRRLKEEYVIWLTTVGSDLTPQPRPVWFIWDNDSFLIYSQAKAFKVRHVEQHPAVALHFNADDQAEQDVVIFIGEAHIDHHAPQPDQSAAYMKKYASGIKDLGSTAEGFSGEYSVAIRIKPLALRA